MTKTRKPGGHIPGSHLAKTVDNKMASAYSLPTEERRTDDIAESLCRILDDDSPRPMMKLRPAKKTPNAAEQFYAEHHQPYEAYGARSRDKMEAVRAHNTAYPKMHDELKKKRSMAKVTTNFAQRRGIAKRTANNRCGACRSRKEFVKRRGPSRYITGENRKRVWPLSSSITKPKARQQKVTKQRLAKITSKRMLACQKKMAVEKGTLTSPNLLKLASGKKSNSSSHSEDGSSKNKNPDTDASLSSYNSYASLEHEPMVAE